MGNNDDDYLECMENFVDVCTYVLRYPKIPESLFTANIDLRTIALLFLKLLLLKQEI